MCQFNLIFKPIKINLSPAEFYACLTNDIRQEIQNTSQFPQLHYADFSPIIQLVRTVTFLWGFNFVVIEIGLDSFPPILFSALRFSCAAFPAVLFWSKGNIEWRWIISIGVILGILMYSFLFVGMSVGMSAGLSSIILQIQAVLYLLTL
jgi:hypothetical protein